MFRSVFIYRLDDLPDDRELVFSLLLFELDPLSELLLLLRVEVEVEDELDLPDVRELELLFELELVLELVVVLDFDDDLPEVLPVVPSVVLRPLLLFDELLFGRDDSLARGLERGCCGLVAGR